MAPGLAERVDACDWYTMCENGIRAFVDADDKKKAAGQKRVNVDHSRTNLTVMREEGSVR